MERFASASGITGVSPERSVSLTPRDTKEEGTRQLSRMERFAKASGITGPRELKEKSAAQGDITQPKKTAGVHPFLQRVRVCRIWTDMMCVDTECKFLHVEMTREESETLEANARARITRHRKFDQKI